MNPVNYGRTISQHAVARSPQEPCRQRVKGWQEKSLASSFAADLHELSR